MVRSENVYVKTTQVETCFKNHFFGSIFIMEDSKYVQKYSNCYHQKCVQAAQCWKDSSPEMRAMQGNRFVHEDNNLGGKADLLSLKMISSVFKLAGELLKEKGELGEVREVNESS